MSCAFPQPPSPAFAVPLGLLSLIGLPTPPTARASVALPGVPAAPTLALAVPTPPIPSLPTLPTPRALPALPGVLAVPTVALAIPLPIAALLAWVLSLPIPRSIPCPLN
jgi:hypothetical protein